METSTTVPSPRKFGRKKLSIILIIIFAIALLVGVTIANQSPADVYIGAVNTHNQFNVSANSFGESVSTVVDTYDTYLLNRSFAENQPFAYTMIVPSLSVTSSVPVLCTTTTVTIDSITVTTAGFALQSESPSLPLTLSYLSDVSVTLTILAPSHSYSGTLDLLITGSVSASC
jgi:hypothetical protein